MDPEEKIKLRPLMLMITQVEGRDYIVAQDQTREAAPVMLPAELEPFLRMLDGTRSIRDMQVELTRAMGGKLVPIDEITKIIEELDSNLLLDSPRYRETVELDKRFWKQIRLRKPFHAGQAYPTEPDELAEMLDGFYRDPSGPKENAGDESAFVRGVLAPHIDVKSGGPTFAWAYNSLKSQPRAELFVLLGTAHNQTAGPISISRKDYATPLGIPDTDNEFIDRLTDTYSPPWLMDDMVHRTEHSIEFQAVFLKHLLGDDTAKVVPILIGGFSDYVQSRSSPSEDKQIAEFLDAFQKVVDKDERTITYIVGGDLAHIGPRYGHPEPVLPADIEACKAKDVEMLDAAAKGAEEFFDYVAAEGDRRNICGMPPMYIMLKLIEKAEGTVLHHSHWFDESTRSAVTFAAMLFT